MSPASSIRWAGSARPLGAPRPAAREFDEFGDPTHEDQVAIRRRWPAPPAAGWSWRSRCRRCPARDDRREPVPQRGGHPVGLVDGQRGLHQRRRPWPRSSTAQRRPRPRRSATSDRRSGASPSVPSTSSWSSCPISEDRYPSSGEAPGLLVHLGHQRAGRVDHGQAARGGLVPHRRARRRGRRTRRGAPSRHLVELVDEHRAALLQVGDHVGVVHDLRDARRPARRSARAPARRCRWPARRRRRTTAATASSDVAARDRGGPPRRATGAAARSERSAATPRARCRGAAAASRRCPTITRTTASGRPGAAAASCADLHVDGERTGRGQLAPARRRRRCVVDDSDPARRGRAGRPAAARPASSGADGQRDRSSAVAAHLAGDHDVAGLHLRGQATGRRPSTRDRPVAGSPARPPAARAARRPCRCRTTRARGSRREPRRARPAAACTGSARVIGRPCRRNRPSALIGNTSRYRW